MKEVVTDAATARKFFFDRPEDDDREVTFVLSLHGGGSVGEWQRAYFPIYKLVDEYRLVVATPSCATKEPFRMWVPDADDAHLRNIVDYVLGRYGGRVRAFWLAGHSQGGMTSNRLLKQDYFADRVDGWLSLSGGRIGAAEVAQPFFPGKIDPTAFARSGVEPPRPGRGSPPDCDFSFIFTTGEHEIVKLPDASPWAEKYGAGPRERGADIVDTEPGLIYDTLREGKSNKAWGLYPGPGSAEVWTYPGARDGRVIADVVRLGKGHTEGLEPNVTEALVRLMLSAPGGKLA
jgi:hypothetical protein